MNSAQTSLGSYQTDQLVGLPWERGDAGRSLEREPSEDCVCLWDFLTDGRSTIEEKDRRSVEGGEGREMRGERREGGSEGGGGSEREEREREERRKSER